jgi:hypothetical protein
VLGLINQGLRHMTPRSVSLDSLAVITSACWLT